MAFLSMCWLAIQNARRLAGEWRERRAIARGHINDRSVTDRLRAIGAGR